MEESFKAWIQECVVKDWIRKCLQEQKLREAEAKQRQEINERELHEAAKQAGIRAFRAVKSQIPEALRPYVLPVSLSDLGDLSGFSHEKAIEHILDLPIEVFAFKAPELALIYVVFHQGQISNVRVSLDHFKPKDGKIDWVEVVARASFYYQQEDDLPF